MIGHILLFVGLYFFGSMVALLFAANHWRENYRHRIDWDSEGAWLWILPIFWPIILIFGVPVILVSRLVKFLFHVGVYGNLTPRTANLVRRIRN